MVPASADTTSTGHPCPAVLALAAILALASPMVAQATLEPDAAAIGQPAVPAADEASTRGPEARLHALVNRHREANACPPLRWHAPSASVAEARSADMIARRYFDHVTPDGRTVFDALAAAKIEASGGVAENIALTQAGAPSAFEMWRDSRPHRRNLDNCSYTHHGLGERGGVWTQILLARPQPAVPDTGLSRPEPASPRR